jgi:NAD(P)H-flavin reductase
VSEQREAQKSAKQFLSCAVVSNTAVDENNFVIAFEWNGTAPKAGQFFMVKPERSSVFLARPISVFSYAQNVVRFLITKVGKGTEELGSLQTGERATLTGALGNAWCDFLDPAFEKIALVGGEAGIAPLAAFAEELSASKTEYDFFAGYKSRSFGLETIPPHVLTVTSEDGASGKKGLLLDYFTPEHYDAVFVCGSNGLLKAVSAACAAHGTHCFVSTDNYMACGVGACLGCTIHTSGGNKRCCADGAIFKSSEVVFDE